MKKFFFPFIIYGILAFSPAMLVASELHNLTILYTSDDLGNVEPCG